MDPVLGMRMVSLSRKADLRVELSSAELHVDQRDPNDLANDHDAELTAWGAVPSLLVLRLFGLFPTCESVLRRGLHSGNGGVGSLPRP